MAEIRPHLIARGIRDLTGDVEGTSVNPIAAGGFADIYEGGLNSRWKLRDSSYQTSYMQQTSASSTGGFSSNSARSSHIRFRCARVAIKIHRSNPDSAGYHTQIASIIYKWSKCQHPNVLQLLGFAVIDDRIGLVLPLGCTGTVMNYVKRLPAWRLETRLGLCTQISKGVSYLHSVDIIHGDIKGDNVLVSGDGTAMLTDFDEAEIGERSLVFTGGVDGRGLSLCWAAPELLRGAGPLRKTRVSDVYALAMEVLSGKPPYFGSNAMARVAALISQGNRPIRPHTFLENYKDDLWDLLVQCWQYEPETRPSANYIANIMAKMSPRNREIPEPYPIDNRPQWEPARAPPHWPPGVISREMYTSYIISRLEDHGCQDISEKLDNSTFSTMPTLYGGSGDVFRGNLLDSTLICLKIPRFTHDDTEKTRNQVYASREIHTWNKCKHPNILPFLGLAEFRNRLAMVSPWMKNGSMRNYLKQNPNADRYHLGGEICAGVAYLHSINIVHGDLKGDNVLISDDGSPLLTDFGSADIKNRTIKFTQLMDQCGWTMRWGAPELLQEIVLLSKESDVYALGMTILEAMTGELPFADKQEMAVMLAVCFKQEIPTRPTAEIPVNCERGDKLWELLCQCWSPEPEKRPTAIRTWITMRSINCGQIPLQDHENQDPWLSKPKPYTPRPKVDLSTSSLGDWPPLRIKRRPVCIAPRPEYCTGQWSRNTPLKPPLPRVPTGDSAGQHSPT